MDAKRERGGWLVPVVLAVALLLPPLYVLSIGPACWLYDRGAISGDTLSGYAWPSETLRAASKPYHRVLSRYEQLFLKTKYPPTPRHLR